ncbi:MAG: 16S rRNA (uracil(1498)-N(3))-methyltransferase [Carnobacterium alterfunditum]
MQRYFLNEDLKDYQNQTISIGGDSFHHMIKVMRMKVDHRVYLVTKDQQAFIAKINAIEENKVLLNWVEDDLRQQELPIDVTIASGLPKGDKLDLIVQKGTELGASAFIPFAGSFSITKWDTKKAAKKIERLQKIAQEAAEQSHRTKVPTLQPLASVKQLIEMKEQFDVCLVAYEESAKAGEDQNFVKGLKMLPAGGKLLIVFGPEGGLSKDEVGAFIQSGFLPCALGPRILRTETAPLYALAAASYHFELMYK